MSAQPSGSGLICIDSWPMLPTGVIAEYIRNTTPGTVLHVTSESCLELDPSSIMGSGECEQKPNSPEASIDLGEVERLIKRPQTLWNTHIETLDGFGHSPASTTSSIGCNDQNYDFNSWSSPQYFESDLRSQIAECYDCADFHELQTLEEIDAKNAIRSDHSRRRRESGDDIWRTRRINGFCEDARDFRGQEFSCTPNAPQSPLSDPDASCQSYFCCRKSEEVKLGSHILCSRKEFDQGNNDTREPHISDRSSKKAVTSSGNFTRRQPAVKAELKTYWDLEPEILLQPETRPISHEQLLVEVKDIYAGLVMVEAKCIDVDQKQALAAQEPDPSKQTKLTGDQWQALIALHRTLLDEHHDFFLATQHPSAGPSLRNLPARYDMPRRMWQHGVHAFLELLLHRLPESSNAMDDFIHEAYSTLEHLYEKVPMFRDTWKECLVDLNTYRKALDPGGYKFMKIRSRIASSWFGQSKVSGKILDDLNFQVSQGGKTCLPMVINGVTIDDGRHDTGAEGNFMTHELARSLRLRIRRKSKSLTLATGRMMQTVGRVHVWCTFAKEPGTRVKCWFHVCSNLTASLVMGSAFLAATKTLTKFKHRLKEKIVSSGSIPTVNLIGSSMKAQRRFACRVDGRWTNVNADSASGLDLLSPEYVKANKLRIDRRREVRKRIRLADQSQAETIGQVKVTIELGDGLENVYERVFDVLPGLTSEILFGEDFLGLIDAFCSHESSFVTILSEKRHFELNILENLGPVNNFLKNAIWGRGRSSMHPPSLYPSDYH